MIFTVDNYTQMEVRPKMDVVLVSGDYWADHPHSGIGVIARVLSDHGYQVGIIEKPDWTTTVDFKILVFLAYSLVFLRVQLIVCS